MMGRKRVFLLENASLDAHLDPDSCMTVAAVTDEPKLDALCSFTVWKWKGMLLGGL